MILISIDTLRADHLPAYGYSGVATPNIDMLRREATLFRNAYAPAPMTLPSHVTMLTGLLPPEHGIRDNVGFRFDPAKHPTIESVLHGAGYMTGAAVSSYVLRGETGLSGSFDFFEDSIEPPPGARFRDYERSGFVTEKLAQEWIDKQTGAFFLFFHIYEPHVPYAPPEPFRTRYAANPYDGEIATSDAIVGLLLDHLKRKGIYDRAIIVLLSDHGEGLGDHGEKQHSVLVYRETIHVPLIIKLPKGAHAPEEIREPATLADLFATITSLLGVRSQAHTAGLPLFGKLPGNRSIYSESLYARFHYGWSELKSLTDGGHQFIDSARPELFDIRTDPAERHDLAAVDRRDVAAYRGQLASFPSGEAIPSPVSADEKARLSALGYLSGPASSTSAPVNPADRIADIEALQHATALAAQGDMQSAAAAFRGVLTKNPQMTEAWIQFGDALMRFGAFQQAAGAYQKALSLSPHVSGDLLISLGSAYLRTGDLNRAQQSGEAALAVTPHLAHVLLAETALARGDVATASREVSSIDRPSASDLVLSAEIEQRQGRFEATLALLDQAETAARSRGESAVPRLEALRGDTYARMNRLPEAAASFEKEIAAFPNELPAYSHLALVRAIAGDRRGAEEVLARMIRANPGPAAQRVAEDARKALR